MSFKTTSPLKRLPAALRKRAGERGACANSEEAFQEVLRHYGLCGAYEALESAPDYAECVRREASLWQSLALRLLEDYVPAFQKAGKRGRKSTLGKPDLDTWLAVGGTILCEPADMTTVYQAQLVMVIDRLMQRKKQHQAAIFRWLANETQRVSGERLASRRAILPLPFRNRTTSRSLEDAYRAIPEEIRRAPAAHIGALVMRPASYIELLSERWTANIPD